MHAAAGIPPHNTHTSLPTASRTAAPASLKAPPATTDAAVPVTFTARANPLVVRAVTVLRDRRRLSPSRPRRDLLLLMRWKGVRGERLELHEVTGRVWGVKFLLPILAHQDGLTGSGVEFVREGGSIVACTFSTCKVEAVRIFFG